MELETLILSEVCQKKKDKYHMISKMNLSTERKLMDLQNRLVVAKGDGEGSGMAREFGVNRCKLLHLGWINNEVLLYRTGNYI